MRDYFKKISIMFVMSLILVLGYSTSVFAEDIDSNTTLLMHMDDSGLKDELGHSVTNSGVTLDTTNKVFGNGSAYFDGTNNYISIAKGADFSFDTGDFTISCFVNTSTYNISTYYRRIFTLGGGDSANTIQMFFYNNNKITVYSNQVEIAGNRVVADGNWHHVAITRSSGVLRLFVDGVLDGTTTFTNSLTAGASYNPRIGVYGGNLTGGFFKGNIDELMIVKGKALWTTGFMPPTTPYGEAISLDKSSINLTVNDTQQLTATTSAGAGVTWTTSDPSIATVDSNGKVTAKGVGNCTITVTTIGGLTATCTVTVTELTTPIDPQSDGSLYIELVDGNIKIYDVSADEITNFINWYKNRDLDDSELPYYKFTKGTYKDYIVHDKIVWFEIR